MVFTVMRDSVIIVLGPYIKPPLVSSFSITIRAVCSVTMAPREVRAKMITKMMMNTVRAIRFLKMDTLEKRELADPLSKMRSRMRKETVKLKCSKEDLRGLTT